MRKEKEGGALSSKTSAGGWKQQLPSKDGQKRKLLFFHGPLERGGRKSANCGKGGTASQADCQNHTHESSEKKNDIERTFEWRKQEMRKQQRIILKKKKKKKYTRH